jgi:hypothetical protein
MIEPCDRYEKGGIVRRRPLNLQPEGLPPGFIPTPSRAPRSYGRQVHRVSVVVDSLRFSPFVSTNRLGRPLTLQSCTIRECADLGAKRPSGPEGYPASHVRQHTYILCKTVEISNRLASPGRFSGNGMPQTLIHLIFTVNSGYISENAFIRQRKG